MLSGSPTSKLTRNWNCGCPPNISIQSSEGRVAHGVWNAFTKLLRIDWTFPHFSRYPLSLGGWMYIKTLFYNHKIEREAGVPFWLLFRQEKKRKLLIFCARVWSIQGIGRGEIWGNFQGKQYQERFATYRSPSFQSWYHSMVAGIFQWKNGESCMKNIGYFLSLSPPRNHDILLEAIKLVFNLTCNMANVAALSFLPVGSPLATVILCWYLWRSVRSILNSKNQAGYLFGVE